MPDGTALWLVKGNKSGIVSTIFLNMLIQLIVNVYTQIMDDWPVEAIISFYLGDDSALATLLRELNPYKYYEAFGLVLKAPPICSEEIQETEFGSKKFKQLPDQSYVFTVNVEKSLCSLKYLSTWRPTEDPTVYLEKLNSLILEAAWSDGVEKLVAHRDHFLANYDFSWTGKEFLDALGGVRGLTELREMHKSGEVHECSIAHLNMPKNTRSKKGRKAGKARIGGRGPGRQNSQVSKLAAAVKALGGQPNRNTKGQHLQARSQMRSGASKGEADLVGSILRMVRDPCNAPPKPIPDPYNGKVQILKSVDRHVVTMDASGNRVYGITPCSYAQVYISGASVFSTFISTSSGLYAGEFANNDNFKHFRAIAMCAKFTPQLPADTQAPTAETICIPNVTSNTFTTLAHLDNQPRDLQPSRAPFEVAWCPRQVTDYVPLDCGNSSAYLAGTDILGQKIHERPAIWIMFKGGPASTVCGVLEITTVWECFLDPLKEYRMGVTSPSNQAVLDKVLNALPSVLWSSAGEAVERVSSYAARIAKAAASPAGQAALSVGKSLVMAAL
jgi:hypothetical protein